MADDYLTFDTKINTAGFKSGLGQITGMFTKLATLAGVAFSVAGVVAFGRAAVQAAGQAEAKFKGLEFLMKANGRSMSQATAFIKEFTADGLVPLTSAYESYKNMVSRGYSTEQIEKMLAVMKDAAVYNRQGQFSMGEAMEKATMGLRMENSLLTDSVGIQKNVAKMWQEHAQTLGTVAGSLTMAQKRQAEFNGFMKEGGVFAGAAQGYLNSYAGKMGQLTSSFTNLKVAVGNAIIPFLNAMLPAINAAILWFTRLFNIIGRVVNLLFGTNVGMVDAEAAIAGSAEQTAAATGETAANTEAAGKAAKGALASFDKLNVLAQDTSGSGGGGAGGGVAALPTEDQAGGVSEELDKLKEKFSSVIALITGSFASGDFTEIATSVSSAVIGALTEARKKIQGFDFEQFGSDIGKGVNQVAKSVKSFLENINFKEIGTQYSGLLSDVFKGMLDTGIGFLEEVDWSNVGNTIWTGIESAFEFVWGYLKGFDWAGLVSRVFELLGAALGAATQIVVTLGKAIWEKLKEAWGAVKTYFEGFKDEAGGDIWQGIKDGIVNAGKNIAEWVKKNVVDPFIEGFKKAFGISSPSTLMAQQGAPIIDGLKKGITDAWASVGQWINTTIVQPLKDWFSQAWIDIADFATGAWDTVKTKWGEAVDWFETTLWGPIKQKAEEIWEAVSKGASNIAFNIGEAMRGAINGVIDWFNGAITDIESAINSLINWLNNLKILGVDLGLNFSNVDLPSIPIIKGGTGGEIRGLATGAVIPPNAPFMAVMGDQRRGTNLEAPESLIRQIVREEAGNAGGQNITITFGGTMGELVRQLKPHIERETMRTGGNMMAKAVRI